MKCLKCGSDNLDNAVFCSSCGGSLTPVETSGENNLSGVDIAQQNPVAPVVPVEQGNINQTQITNSMNTSGMTQQTNAMPVNQSTGINTSNDNKLNYIKYLIDYVMKPVETYQNEKDKLVDTKNAFIITGIVSVMMMVSLLINAIFAVVKVTSYFSSDVSWDWSNLQDINYFSILGKSLIISMIILLAIAGVYYLASLVIKKNGNFKSILSIVSSSAISLALTIFLSPLLGIIWSDLSTLIVIIGIMYFLITFVTIINDELGLESNMKVYFNLVCLVVIFIVSYFVLQRLLLSSIGF